MSGKIPFHNHADITVFLKVLKGEHPPRGVGFTENLWKMLEMCWSFQPNNRPSIEDVLQCLEAISIFSEPHLYGANEETEKGDNDSRDESKKGSSGVPNGMSDTVMIESVITISTASASSTLEDSYQVSGIPR